MMKRLLSSLTMVILSTTILAIGQVQNETPEEYLRMLPIPARTSMEALNRCPVDADTLMRNVVRALSALAGKDAQPEELLVAKQQILRDTFVVKLQHQLDRQILIAGEQIDKEIQACPKVENAKGKQVYDEQCVREAEERGRNQRVAAVDKYLAGVHTIWAEYLRETRRILSESKNGKWRIVHRLAVDVALITQLAGQFTR